MNYLQNAVRSLVSTHPEYFKVTQYSKRYPTVRLWRPDLLSELSFEGMPLSLISMPMGMRASPEVWWERYREVVQEYFYADGPLLDHIISDFASRCGFNKHQLDWFFPASIRTSGMGVSALLAFVLIGAKHSGAELVELSPKSFVVTTREFGRWGVENFKLVGDPERSVPPFNFEAYVRGQYFGRSAARPPIVVRAYRAALRRKDEAAAAVILAIYWNLVTYQNLTRMADTILSAQGE